MLLAEPKSRMKVAHSHPIENQPVEGTASNFPLLEHSIDAA